MYGYVISIEVSVIFNEKIIFPRKKSKFSKWRVVGFFVGLDFVVGFGFGFFLMLMFCFILEGKRLSCHAFLWLAR